MTKIEVFKAGGYMTDEEERLRDELSGSRLDGTAAAAIFGSSDAFIDPVHHLIVARDLTPVSGGGRIAAAMAIGSTWLDNTWLGGGAFSRIFGIQSCLLPDAAVIDDPHAPIRFGIMARAARRYIDRRADGIGLLGTGDAAVVDEVEGQFRYLASGVGENQYIRQYPAIKEIMGGVALVATVKFPPFLRR